MTRSSLRSWPGGAGATFVACFCLGILLALGTVLATRAWSRPRPAGPAGAPGTAAGSAARGGSTSPVSATEVNTRLERADQHLAAERYNDAFSEYTRASEAAPADARPHYGLALVYRQIDRMELAERALRRALELDPKLTTARLKLAQVIYDLGKHEESVRLLMEVEKEKPGQPAVWWLLARNEARRGKPKEAIPWLERYTAALPRNAYGWAYLGRARSDIGDLSASEKDYRNALSLDPNLTLGWLWLGQLLVATGRKPEAEQALTNFRRLKALDDEVKRCLRDLLRRPDDTAVLSRLVEARSQLGQYKEALVPLGRLLELRPGEPQLIQARDELIRAIEKGRQQREEGKQAYEESAPSR